MSRLLAVDPSLTCSGWALFRVTSGELLAVGKLRAEPPVKPLSVRLASLQKDISDLLHEAELGVDDYLVCEGATTMRDPNAAFKVEQVRGLFETLARARRVNVPGRLNPRSVQKEVMGLKGKQIERKQVKANAREVFKALYSTTCVRFGWEINEKMLSRNQDIVDAALIGTLAVSRIQRATPETIFFSFMEKQDEKRIR